MTNFYDLVWSPDGNSLLVWNYNGSLWWYSARDFDAQPQLMHQQVRYVRYSSDGSFLFFTTADDTLIIWETQSNCVQRVLSASGYELNHHFTLSPREKLVATVGVEALRDSHKLKVVVLVWEIETGELRFIIPSEHMIYDLDLNPTGDQLAYLDEQVRIHLCDLTTGRELDYWDTPTPRGFETLDEFDFGWYPAGIALWYRILAAYLGYPREDKGKFEIFLWNTKAGTREKLLVDPGQMPIHEVLGFKLEDKWQLDINLVKDLGFLIMYEAGNQIIEAIPMYIRVWNPVTGDEAFRIENDLDDYYHGIALSPDGKILTMIQPEGVISLYEIPGGKLIRTVKIPAAE